jgi:hypothetical protein
LYSSAGVFGSGRRNARSSLPRVGHVHSFGHPLQLHPREETKREGRIGWLRRPTCRVDGHLRLAQRQSCVFQERPSRGGQLDAANASDHEWDANFVFQVPDLPAE